MPSLHTRYLHSGIPQIQVQPDHDSDDPTLDQDTLNNNQRSANQKRTNIDQKRFQVDSPISKIRILGREAEHTVTSQTVVKKPTSHASKSKIRFVSDGLDLNSRHSESQSMVKSSQVQIDAIIKSDFSQTNKRKYQSLTARRDKQAKKKNFNMWIDILKLQQGQSVKV